MNLYWDCCNTSTKNNHVFRIPITKETLLVLLESYSVAVKKSKEDKQ